MHNFFVTNDFVLVPVDLSLYKDESQIEKKTSGKRKAGEKSESTKKASPAAKKPKVETPLNRPTPAAKAKSIASTSKSSKVILSY